MKIKEHYQLRKPTGTYTVGSSSFTYDDTSDGAHRVIPCLCWYPASGLGAGALKKYVNETILPGAGGIETNTYTDAPVAEGKFPLILFNHGFSLGLESNTVQCEELASHGYILLSIGHPGSGSYELPNGELSLFELERVMAHFNDEAAIGGEFFLKYGRWLTGEGKDASLDQQRAHYQTFMDRQPKMTAESEIWLRDSLFVLDQFLNGGNLADHVDTASIGALGMSFGGSVALSLAQLSDRIKASADLDGFFYGARWPEPLKKPALLMHHDDLGGYFLTYPFLNAASDAYMVTVNQTTHGNFADYNDLLAENPINKGVLAGEEIEYAMLGKIDPDRMATIVNSLLLDFFDKYLKGQPSRLIDTDHLPAEITLQRK